MNKGGEPERDDYGLPPVDIDVPDDARELDADVQAYHRELRALRRQARSLRWRLRGSGQMLQRTGLVMPLIAGCLVLAMLSGMVLTMFTANSYFNRGGRPASPGSGRRSNSPAASLPPGVQLPSELISVNGSTPVVLSDLTRVALAVIPPHCGCDTVVRALLQQAGSAGLVVYLVGAPGSRAQIRRLASASQASLVWSATEVKGRLLPKYPRGLTVLLVDSQGNATKIIGLQQGFRLERRLALIAGMPPHR